MDLYNRYVFKQVTNALVMILGSLTAIVWIATSLKQIDNISGGGFWLFFQMTTLAMPQAMSIVTPFALLIACLYSLHKLNLDSELIVMTASGATVWRLLRPYFFLGMIISALVLFSNLYVQPASMQKLREFIVKVRTDLIAHVLQPGKFSSPSGGKLTFHIRNRAKNGDLLGLLVQDEREPKQQLTYLAEIGELIKVGPRAFLKMKNGHIHRKQNDKDGVQIVKFDEYIFDLSEFGQPKQGGQFYKPKERFLSQLRNPTENERKNKKLMGQLNAEFHNRFASTLYPLLFAILAVACLGVARSNRQNTTKTLVIGFSIGLMFRLAGLVAVNLLRTDPYAVILVYGIPLIGMLLGSLYIWRYMQPEIFSKFLPDKAFTLKPKQISSTK